ncbi:hypothetical protein OUZ56_031348 [Daphnia magna]|uniref:Uncharacterized protein n=1 Tax=Daphnia magna TaxID=35525 RepID=A0ABQ9ZU01_9CRUS|nr:hypothetical protein OUZ56_031348 [Daphnia magna]
MAQLTHGYQELPSWFSDPETSIVKSFQYVLLDLNSWRRNFTIGQNPNGRSIENVGPLLMNFHQHSSTRRTRSKR